MNDFILPPVEQPPVEQSSGEQPAPRSGFPVPTKDDLDKTTAATTWERGTLVRVERRVTAVDPLTRESFIISAHTRGRVVPPPPTGYSVRGLIAVQITAPVDNGEGRLALFNPSDLLAL